MEYIDNLPPMDLMRSEKMVFFQLIMPFESAQRAISYLGELGLLQFCDIESCPLQKQALQTLDDNNNGFQRLMEGFLGPRRHPNFVFGLIDKYVQKLELFVHCWK